MKNQQHDVRIQNEGDGEFLLLCPRCGGDYLHHGAVVIKDRPEDQDGVCTIVGYQQISQQPIDKDQCEGRRDSLFVRFMCEFCGERKGYFWLEIQQHKGRTFLAWKNPVGITKDLQLKKAPKKQQ
jgi:hypothetical protein